MVAHAREFAKPEILNTLKEEFMRYADFQNKTLELAVPKLDENGKRFLKVKIPCESMGLDSLATPCGLYCGSCRYYLAEECMGCGTEDREGCNLYNCCRGEKKLNFCAECDGFPCPNLKKSVGLHPKWLDSQAKFQLKEKD